MTDAMLRTPVAARSGSEGATERELRQAFARPRPEDWPDEVRGAGRLSFEDVWRGFEVAAMCGSIAGYWARRENRRKARNEQPD